MSIIGLLVILALIGLFTWLIVTKIPMTPGIKSVITVAALVICVLICLGAFGLLGNLNMKVPTVH